jgi:hypothetical protein
MLCLLRDVDTDQSKLHEWAERGARLLELNPERFTEISELLALLLLAQEATARALARLNESPAPLSPL